MRSRTLLLISLIVAATAILTACGSSTSPSNSMTSTSAPRTVTVNWMNTYWTPTGAVQVPALSASSLGVSVLVPQADGSLTVLPGSTTAPGVISVADVPAGYYWLTFGPIETLAPSATSAYWTNTSTFDAGRDIPGSPVDSLNSQVTTTFDFNLSGLDPALIATSVEFSAEQALPLLTLGYGGGSTNLSISIPLITTTDWSQVNTAFLTQYVPSTLESLNNLVLGPEATLSNLSLTNGATNQITATLQENSPASLNFAVQGSQWVSLFSNAGPATATPAYSAFLLYAEPYVIGANALGAGVESDINLASTAPSGLGISSIPFNNCQASGFPVGIPLQQPQQPAITTDQNFGDLLYQDPFPAPWTRRRHRQHRNRALPLGVAHRLRQRSIGSSNHKLRRCHARNPRRRQSRDPTFPAPPRPALALRPPVQS
jgi:hypothetical protein